LIDFPSLEEAQALDNAYVIAMQKGGVGKTTTAVNCAAALARRGKRVRLVDLDPQSSLSIYFKYVFKEPIQASMYNLLIEGKPIEPVRFGKYISILPASTDLAACNQLFTVLPTTRALPNKVLARSLAPYAQDVDYLIIDCPPSLEPLTINGLVAARYALVPVSTEEMSEDVLPKILNTIKAVRKDAKFGANPHLEVKCLLPTLYSGRGKSAATALANIRSDYEGEYFVYPEPVRRLEAYQKAVSQSADVGAIDFDLGEFWNRFVDRIFLQVESQVAV